MRKQFSLAVTQPDSVIAASPCRFFLWAALFAWLISPALSQADILTDPSQLSGTNTLVDFEALAEGGVSNPLAIAGAVFSGPGPLEVVNSLPYGPPPVVFRHVLRTYNGSYQDLRIDFASAVSEVGFGMWDPNLGGNYLRVYGLGDNLLESAEFPTGAPGGGYASFRGIRRPVNEIAYAILNLSSPSEVYGIDNVSFGANAIPEPAGLGAGIAVATAGLMTRRTRRRQI